MKNLVKIGSVASLAVLCSCGSIVNGTTQPVCVTSNPTNARVYVDQHFVGQTPIVTKMTRKDRHVVRIECEGYQPYEVCFDRRMSKWVFGNLLFGGIPGVAIDAVSGGLYKLNPNNLHADLGAGQQQIARHNVGDGQSVVVVDKADSSWEKIGQLQTENG